LFPEEGESFFVFEAASISLFPVGEEVGPAVRGGRGIREGKINEIPELKGKVAL
jgi:hypothetical protein